MNQTPINENFIDDIFADSPNKSTTDNFEDRVLLNKDHTDSDAKMSDDAELLLMPQMIKSVSNDTTATPFSQEDFKLEISV